MKIVNSGIINPLMIGLIPILFIFTNNLIEIALHSVIIPITIILGTTILSIFFLSKITKNIQKTTLVISLFLIVFFAISYLREGLFGLEVFGIILNQIPIVAFMAFLILSIGVFLIHKIRDWKKPIQIFTAISVVIVISFIPNIILDYADDSYSQNSFLQEIKFKNIEKPNIYLIVLDGYASEKSLKKDFDFDNSNFLNDLKNFGFVIPEHNSSNYRWTVLSMNSALNMNYLHHQEGLSAGNFMLQKYIFSKNLVMKTFQDNGYNTIFIDGGAAHREISVSNKNLCQYTDNQLLQSLMDNSALKFIPQEYFNDIWKEPRNCSFSELEKIHEIESEPFFVYSHHRTPHEPFTRDADGNYIEYAEKFNEIDKETAKKRYVYQLEYTNKKITEIISKILSVEPKPIIILVSDHGWQQFASSPPTNEELIQWYSNFQAFYLPGIDSYESYENISLVNIFRVIFNDYFETDLEILENKVFFVNMNSKENYLDQRDITDIINSGYNKKLEN